MSKRSPIFVSALLLTAVHLMLRFVGTSFQVYISNQIGAAGVGLLQLVMSVGSLAMISGMAGIRTGTMYLTAEEVGKNRCEQIPWVLSGCFRYSIVFSCAISAILYLGAPFIAETWIGEPRIEASLRLYAAFLPVTCLCGVMSGLFTAENKITTLAAVEIAEQLLSMMVTIVMLKFFGGTDPVKACSSVILGSCVGSCMTLLSLILLHVAATAHTGKRISVRKRLIRTALPLAAADVLKAGINTTENLMVPNRLKQNNMTEDPLAAFGIVTGMVFPVIMFPCCILYGLAELLIPELARCSAAGSQSRIEYLVKRSLKVAMLYGLLFGGLIYLTAEELCIQLYQNIDAAESLQWYALLIPMLYCDTITDAMTKGLGQQTICVKYNIITSAMDVLFLFILLPEYGMKGYFFSFLVTHAINFALSLRRLLLITKQRIPFYIPALSLAGAGAAVFLSSQIPNVAGRTVAFPAVMVSLLFLLQVISREDLNWVLQLWVPKREVSA